MYQLTYNYLGRRGSHLASLLVLTLITHPILAQEKRPATTGTAGVLTASSGPATQVGSAPFTSASMVKPLEGGRDARGPNLQRSGVHLSADLQAQQQTSAPPAKRFISISDAVSIFLQQNLQLVAARYDIDTAEAEKLTARLRPNPEFSVGSSDLPLDLTGNLLAEQTFSYSISQTFELGGKRRKRIDAANANSDLARAQFEAVLWQLTNDLKKKFYTVLLDQSLLKLAKENQKTFDETIKHTTELFQSGEISGSGPETPRS